MFSGPRTVIPVLEVHKALLSSPGRTTAATTAAGDQEDRADIRLLIGFEVLFDLVAHFDRSRRTSASITSARNFRRSSRRKSRCCGRCWKGRLGSRRSKNLMLPVPAERFRTEAVHMR